MNSAGKILTVCGPIESDELGTTLPHEHILVDFSKGLIPIAATEANNTALGVFDSPITMDNLGLVRRFPYSYSKNVIMDDKDTALSEVKKFKSSGGNAICELSVVGMRCDSYKPEDLLDISERVGVNIVHGTGFYSESVLPEWAKQLSVRQMLDLMVAEVKAPVPRGVVYIGCSYPLRDCEKRSLEAAVTVQKELGLGIVVRPDMHPKSPEEILDLLSAHGASLSHVSVSHLDRTFTSSSTDRASLLRVASRGCYLNHSFFGKECSHFQYKLSFDFPSDAQRIEQVKFLLQSGLEKQLLLSHDIVCNHELVAYGGAGYGHLLNHVIPKMLNRGISSETLNTLTVSNPARFLTIKL